MTIADLLHHLERVRRSGSGWIARCPAHDDRNPSLSIAENSTKILLHCHAGCTAEAICAALGIGIRDLFSGPRTPQQSEPPIVRFAERQIGGLRSRLTPSERDQKVVTVVLADSSSLPQAIARALALTIEGELVQVALDGEAQ